VNRYQPGDLFNLIYSSYKELIKGYSPKNRQKYIGEWKKFDKNAFNNLDIGKCVFVTCCNGKPVGVVSYDPRNFPEYGVIGQNCVIPSSQGQEIGEKQVLEILRIFKENHCRVAKVTTGDHPFFVPAQKMYLSGGFKEAKRRREDDKDFGEIDYEVNLK